MQGRGSGFPLPDYYMSFVPELLRIRGEGGDETDIMNTLDDIWGAMSGEQIEEVNQRVAVADSIRKGCLGKLGKP